MNKSQPHRFLTLRRNSPIVLSDGEVILFSPKNEPSDMFSTLPKYIKPFPSKKIQKMENEYEEWLKLKRQHEYEVTLAEFERRTNSDSAQHITKVSEIPRKNFDESEVKSFIKAKKEKERLHCLQFTNKESNENITFNIKQRSHSELSNSLLDRPSFKNASVIPKKKTIPIFSQQINSRNQKKQKEMDERMIKLDIIETRKKQKRTRVLAKEAQKKNQHRMEELLEMSPYVVQKRKKLLLKSIINTEKMEDRPLTPFSVNAMSEIDCFEKQQKILKKKKIEEEKRTKDIVQGDTSLFGTAAISALPPKI